MRNEPDRVPLSDGWMLWRPFVLRSAGFPFAELTEAVSEEQADEEHLADFDWSESMTRTIRRALDLARSEPVRTAMLWQNPQIVELSVDWLHSTADRATHRNARRRASEHTVVKYLQRYYTKNESVGHFGPVVWGTVEHLPSRITVEPGPTVVGRRNIYFEDWAIDAIGEVFAADPEIAAQLPPSRAHGVVLIGRALTRPEGGGVRLTPAQTAVVRLVDGVRTSRDIAAELDVPVDEVEDILRALIDEGLLRRAFDIPPSLRAERLLAAALDTLAPGPAVRRARAVLDELESARANVARARTSDELSKALNELDDYFTAVTGTAATRRRNEAPFGRCLLVSQAERQVRVMLGTRLVDDLSGPLSLILSSARWLARRAGEEFEAAALVAYEDLEQLFGADSIPLNAVCARLLPSAPRAPWLEELVAELARRWVAILQPDFDASLIVRTAAELQDAVNRSFAGPAPGFHAGRHHSPDIMIAADGPDAIEAGAFEFVLGEVHVAMVTVDGQSFVDLALAPDVVPRCVGKELLAEQPRFVPLHTRLGQFATSGWDHPPPDIFSPNYIYLSFGDRIGERKVAGRVVSAAEVTVRNTGGRLVAILPDGTRHPLLHVLGEYVAYALANKFRVLPPVRHTPRVTIDRLVIARETWRIPYGELEPLTRLAERDAYFGLRDVAARYGIRRHTYWRSAPGVKPIYLDLHSPLLAAVLLRELRRAAKRCREVTFTEMHPGPGQLWLPDVQGRRYTSELRLTVADTTQPATIDSIDDDRGG